MCCFKIPSGKVEKTQTKPLPSVVSPPDVCLPQTVAHYWEEPQLRPSPAASDVPEQKHMRKACKECVSCTNNVFATYGSLHLKTGTKMIACPSPTTHIWYMHRLRHTHTQLLFEQFTYLFHACLSFFALYTVKRSVMIRNKHKLTKTIAKWQIFIPFNIL